MDEKIKRSIISWKIYKGIEKNKFINISSDVKVAKNGIIDLKVHLD